MTAIKEYNIYKCYPFAEAKPSILLTGNVSDKVSSSTLRNGCLDGHTFSSQIALQLQTLVEEYFTLPDYKFNGVKDSEVPGPKACALALPTGEHLVNRVSLYRR